MVASAIYRLAFLSLSPSRSHNSQLLVESVRTPERAYHYWPWLIKQINIDPIATRECACLPDDNMCGHVVCVCVCASICHLHRWPSPPSSWQFIILHDQVREYSGQMDLQSVTSHTGWHLQTSMDNLHVSLTHPGLFLLSVVFQLVPRHVLSLWHINLTLSVNDIDYNNHQWRERLSVSPACCQQQARKCSKTMRTSLL